FAVISFFQAEDGIRDFHVTGVQTCALPISLEKLLPGDLLFFAASKGKNENPRVTHVAIYIGNGEFIHAAGAVRINSFLANRDNYDDFQTRTVVGAKRYIGSEDPLIQLIAQSNYY